MYWSDYKLTDTYNYCFNNKKFSLVESKSLVQPKFVTL